MLLAIDFDGCVVSSERAYDDIHTPLEFLPGALEGLRALKRAGHVLLLWSARANRSVRVDWTLNPLWVKGIVPFDVKSWHVNQPLEEARYQQMLEFVERHLDGVFDAIDQGKQGKPVVDLFFDEKALAPYESGGWERIAEVYGARNDTMRSPA